MNHCESCRYGGNCDKEWRYSKLTYPCERYDKVQTNEEWLRSMTTEQLAEFLFRIWENGYHSTIDIRIPFNFPFGEKWLKQPHQGGES